MLIQSKFRDYYDNCIGYGVDKTISYKRDTSTRRLPIIFGNKLGPGEAGRILAACDGWGPDITALGDYRREENYKIRYISIGVLGVAGTLYKLVLQDIPLERTPRAVHYSSNTMSKELKDRRIGLFGATFGAEFSKPLVRENSDIFIYLGVPSFLAYRDRIILNPCLAEYDFGKIKDGVSVFQEISSFIAGTLNTANSLPMVTDDKSLAESKGFDKHSFRKGPTKNGKRR